MTPFSASPFITRLLFRMVGLLAVMILAGSIFNFFGFFSGIFLYFVFLAYRKNQNKKHTEEILQSEIKEASTFKMMAHHKKLGFGYLGTTANYLFFVPDKKREEAIIINLSYVLNIESTMQATGDYVTVHDNFGSVTTKIQFPVFICEGATPDGIEFGYAFMTDGIGKAKKMFDRVAKNSNALQEVEQRRKFI